MLFAAGAGEAVIAVDRYSDYPEQARTLPKIGDAFSIDSERLLALRPDLVITWRSGTAAKIKESVRRLSIPVLVLDSNSLSKIADEILALARLAGSVERALAVVNDYRSRLNKLRNLYRGSTRVRVFHQISERPLLTFNGTHMVNEIINLCGGENLFANLSALTPQVSTEAVIMENPQVIFAVGPNADTMLQRWRRWPRMDAVMYQHLLTVNADLLHRPGPRVLQGAQAVCEQLDQVRQTALSARSD